MKVLKVLLVLTAVLISGCFAETTEDIETECKYDSDGKNYVGKSLDECSRIRFICEENSEYFSDDCGCGCVEKETRCTEDEKKAEICTTEYSPVCGWFNKEIKCIKYPCAQTYGNRCSACID